MYDVELDGFQIHANVGKIGVKVHSTNSILPYQTKTFIGNIFIVMISAKIC